MSTRGFNAYKSYLCLRNHFKNSEYDFFQYNGTVHVKESTYLTRKDRWKFEKVADIYKENTFRFLLSNFVHDSGFYIGEALQPKYKKIYDDWVSYMDSMSYRFSEDIKTIQEYCIEKNVPFVSLFVCQTGIHPLIYKIYLQEHIHFLTFCILYHLSGLNTVMDNLFVYDPVWSSDSMKIKKTIPFIPIQKEHKEKIQQIINETQNYKK